MKLMLFVITMALFGLAGTGVFSGSNSFPEAMAKPPAEDKGCDGMGTPAYCTACGDAKKPCYRVCVGGWYCKISYPPGSTEGHVCEHSGGCASRAPL